nr:MAG TPA: hypothetical protein [Caudoviricetes sp.]
MNNLQFYLLLGSSLGLLCIRSALCCRNRSKAHTNE